MKEYPFVMNSGLIVNVAADKIDRVQEEINAIKKAEVSSVSGDSRLVIIVHAGSMEEKRDLVKAIEGIDGVLNVSLTYDHFEGNETDI